MSLRNGNYLKSLRVTNGYNVHGMAKIMGMQDCEYENLEKSGTENITLGNCKSLIQNLKINPLELIALFD